jgi:predicted Holliday junction resolvase-like endonuclease
MVLMSAFDPPFLTQYAMVSVRRCVHYYEKDVDRQLQRAYRSLLRHSVAEEEEKKKKEEEHEDHELQNHAISPVSDDDEE